MKNMIKLSAGLLLLGLLGYMLDWHAALKALARAEPGWVAMALLVSMGGVLLSARKWQELLSSAHVALPFGYVARLYWIGAFFSNFLPTSVGGDAVRLALTPSGGRTERVAGTIFAERLTGFLVMLVLCAIGLALGPWGALDPRMHALLIALVVALNVAAIALLLAPGMVAAAVSAVMRLVPRPLERPARKLRNVALAIAQRRQTRALPRALLLSVPFYGTIVLAQYAVLMAVGAHVTLLHVMLLGPVVPLLTIVPISLNGIGVAEGAFVAIYAAAGASPELALAAAVLRRLVDLANSALGGLFWMAQRREEAVLAAAA